MNIYKKESVGGTDPSDHHPHATFATLWALGTVSILIIIKTIAFALSGSAAMLGSLIDTIGDGVISLITFISVRISLAPADEDHRFGHGKIEGFSALIQASFLMGAAVFLIFESFNRFFAPQIITDHGLVIGVSIIAIILTVILVGVQNRSLQKVESLAIEADKGHYVNDVLLNGGVILAAFLQIFTDWVIADSMIGMIIALYIGWTGFDIGKKASDMLMDKEIEEDKRQIIMDIVNAHQQVKGMHDLRTRRTGINVIISFDIELDGDLTLRQAHEVSRDLEYSLLEQFPNAEIMIHKDPDGDTYDTRHRVQGVHH